MRRKIVAYLLLGGAWAVDKMNGWVVWGVAIQKRTYEMQ
jgi:hypothetical protein